MCAPIKVMRANDKILKKNIIKLHAQNKRIRLVGSPGGKLRDTTVNQNCPLILQLCRYN